MVFTEYEKRRMQHFNKRGFSLAEIVKCLHEENISASKTGVWSFLRKYDQTGDINRKKGSGSTTLITEEIRKLIDTSMERDDETTAFQLRECWMKMVTRFPYQQFCDAGGLWVRRFVGVPIASLLGMQIKKRGWHGHSNISTSVR